MTSIEWTDETWNPTVGCSRVSEGCRNCYAERQAFRNMNMGWTRYEGITHKVGNEIRWTGTLRFVPEVLDKPLLWKRPRRIFVNSMSDLFHGALDFHDIAAVYGVMAWATQHTFQVLTKRPERRKAFMHWMCNLVGPRDAHGNQPFENMKTDPVLGAEMAASKHIRLTNYGPGKLTGDRPTKPPWPLPNVWEGVSVEDQPTADERIPILLQTPAAMRFVSYEPALGPVDFEHMPVPEGNKTSLDWIIVGGESGPGARPFDVEWARSVIRQCRRNGGGKVKVFVKQLGAKPTTDHRTRPAGEQAHWTQTLRDKKGGDPSEWPEDLRIREYPEASSFTRA
jgi:protein gp37